MVAEEQIAGWIRDSPFTVAFTGAGISTESGIPDFRSPGGVWAQNQPVYFDDFMKNPEARHEYWRQKSLTHVEFRRAEPNRGHLALSELEQKGRLRGIITQNIDGLHQLAGSKAVLELHGTAREVQCMDCRFRCDAEPMVATFQESEKVPLCPQCEGRLKHATVSFGQSLPEPVLRESAQWSEECGLFLAIGSSLVVQPAASLPAMAEQNGAQLVIINRDETPLDHIADIVVREGIGQTLGRIMDHLD